MPVLLQPVTHWWKCPSCNLVEKTGAVPNVFHGCPALNGVTIPLVEVNHPDDKPDGRHVVVEREDYARNPDVDRVASIRTDHGDGSNDCTVLAPTARITFGG
jgi:hypothetical protein